MDGGIPNTQFDVDNVDEEYERLTGLDILFSVKPTAMDTVKFAIFNDTSGDNIKLVETL